jgi:DNA-binding response OmpR family regulator
MPRRVVSSLSIMRKKKHSILIVEDEGQLNEAYQIILKQAGYNIRVAFNGREALEISRVYAPDLILLDVHMPDMDGLEFLQAYDHKVTHPAVKIIIFSNYDVQDEVDRAYKLGADRYILKVGASARELLQIVENTLNKRVEAGAY